ncbi:MAG TPA: deoxyribose-phosphate aldolase [Candidatus Caldiarchaeum subterraneum]|uniref:Deoxyribose-phosphate aldolase n=1 Tax=Caldiarchaeum subterraneum TaxID=311458 RepID=A0A833EC33_CALS0|nr:deoxyribose-phosphate aldolase [Candidatus Caldarchaeum subterraneum]
MSRYSDIASRIQHTNVSPDATLKDIEKLCRECIEYGFDAAVVNPIWVKEAKRLLRGSGVKVCVALNFPIGASSTLSKVVEIRSSLADGCDEIDFMINVGYLKSGFLDLFRKDVEEVVKAADGRVVKAILETAILTDEELRTAARICEEAGVDYIKNSTGWGKGGPATVEVIKQMRSLVSSRVKIKASGGIRDLRTAASLLEAGAELLGTSRGVQIVKERE